MVTSLPCVINLLTTKSIWFFNKERLYTEKNSIKLYIDSEVQKNFYIIYGNRAIKQVKPSSALIDISLFSELSLKINILKKTTFNFSVFIQLFDENSLVSSIEHDCFSGVNNIPISKDHNNIKYIKIICKITTLESKVFFFIDNLDLIAESYYSKALSPVRSQESLIPNISHQVLNIEEGEKTYSKLICQTNFNFYLNYKKNRKLLVMLPGMTNRSKGVYNFQRYTWANSIDTSLMIFLDPTIKEDNELSIGWFQGDANYYALLGLIDIIKDFIKTENLNESDIFFFGSSGGGFSSLQLANTFPYASIIVINPQIKLKSFYKKEYELLLDYSFPKVDRATVESDFGSRLSVNIDFNLRKNTIYYYQNSSDKHHLDSHLTPFLKSLDKNIFQIVKEGEKLQRDKKLYILLFNDPKIAHTPPKKNKSLDMIQNILENRFNNGAIWYYSGEKIMESINQYLVFNQDNWKFNVKDYVKNTFFNKDSIRVELNDKIGSFYLIQGSRYINAIPNNRFNISEFNKVSIICDVSIIDLELKYYILEFSDKEKIAITGYTLKNGENRIEHTFNKKSIYIKIAFRIESQESYSRFVIERLNINLNLNKKVSLPSISHKMDSFEFTRGESTYSIVQDRTEFNFYLNYKKGKKLLISLPGAIDRKKRVYNFQRYSWSNNVEYSFMSVLDPTIHERNELEIGWFQGKHNNYMLPKFINLLKKIFDKNGIKEDDVVFFGSSAGGFTALQLSNFFPSSIVIVINPQIYINRYYKSKWNQLVEYSYNGMSNLEIEDKFNKRISVNIDFSKRIAPIYYYQNIEDKHHLVHHLKRYMETLDSDIVDEVTIEDKLCSHKKIHIITYSDINKKHTPPNKEETLKIIEIAFKHQVNRR